LLEPVSKSSLLLLLLLLKCVVSRVRWLDGVLQAHRLLKTS